MCTFRHHRRRLSAAAAVALLFIIAALGGTLMMVGMVQEIREKDRGLQGAERQRDHRAVPVRRRLIGPGSSPPTCRARCGRCAPCRPVHVVIQPGRSVPLEYYPEAWRCQCGNKLFMP